MYYVVLALTQPPKILDCALCSFGSQSPSLQEKLCNLRRQSHRYLACESFSFFLVLKDKLLVMSVVMSPGITGVHLPLSSIGTMASKRAESMTPCWLDGP